MQDIKTGTNMNIKKYILTLLSVIFLAASCQVKELVIFNPENVTEPGFASAPDLMMNSGNVNTGSAEYQWEKADFGIYAQIIYSIEAQIGDGPIVEVSSGLSGTKASVSYQVLNERLVKDLGVCPGFPVDVNFYIGAKLADSDKWYSESVKAKVNTVSIEEEYKKMYVVGSFCDWIFNTPQHLYNFDEQERVFEGFVGLGTDASSGIKFTGGTNWSNMSKFNFGLKKGQSAGSEPSSITLENSSESDDIRCFSKSYYQFALDTTSRELTVHSSFNEASVVVNGTPYKMSFASVKQVLYVDVTLTENSEVEFSFDNGRTLGGQYDNLKYDGEALVYPYAGDYRIYLNLNNSKKMYAEFDSSAYGKGEENFVNVFWGIIGLGGNWDTDAATLVMEEGFYTAKDIALKAGEGFKLRKNANWGTNRGAADGNPDDEIATEATIGAATNLAQDGGNICVGADGLYDIYLNAKASRLYIMAAGTEGPGIESEPSEWGIVGSFNEWGESADDVEMYLVKGLYVAYNVSFDQGKGNSFKIRANNVWDDTKNYGLEFGGKVKAGYWYPLLSSGGSGNMNIEDGTYDIWFDERNHRIYILEPGTDVTSAVEGTVEMPATWYLVGNFNSWNPGDARYLMEVEDDYYVFKEFKATTGCEMKFAPGVWSGDIGGSGEFKADTALSPGSDNIKVAAGTYDVYLSKNLKNYWFTTGGKKPNEI